MKKEIYSGHPDQHFGCVTYSQHGEDLMLVNIFSLLGVATPTYLDLGAHHPTHISNTKLLYDRGAHGVNVEANPNLIGAFKLERPRDINVCIGVGLGEGELPFYMYSETSGRNTFSESEVENLKNQMMVKRTEKIKVKTLNQIVNEFCAGYYPNLLSLDLEGLDYDVLKSVDFETSAPLVIIVETRRDETLKMVQMLQEKHFLMLCRMGENIIFVQSQLFPTLFM